jgi:hypothetical protein
MSVKAHCSSVIPFSECDISFPTSVVLDILCTGFEVFKVMRIHDAVWVRTPHSLVHSSEYFGGVFWACLHRPSRDEGSMF